MSAKKKRVFSLVALVTFSSLIVVLLSASACFDGVKWQDNGVEVCYEIGSRVDPAIAPDGARGAIITWQLGGAQSK